MKIREFNIDNYNYVDKMRDIIMESLPSSVFGIDIKNSKPLLVAIQEADYGDRKLAGKDLFSKFEKKDEVIKYFEDIYNDSKNITIKRYKEAKEYIDKILFDDRDYQELCEVLKDNYYCQATTMLFDILDKKTKGSSVKAMKYQARKMQIDDISCD